MSETQDLNFMSYTWELDIIWLDKYIK